MKIVDILQCLMINFFAFMSQQFSLHNVVNIVEPLANIFCMKLLMMEYTELLTYDG